MHPNYEAKLALPKTCFPAQIHGYFSGLINSENMRSFFYKFCDNHALSLLLFKFNPMILASVRYANKKNQPPLIAIAGCWFL
jgi:hypothetical protein